MKSYCSMPVKKVTKCLYSKFVLYHLEHLNIFIFCNWRREKSDVLEVGLCGKLCVKFHFVPVKDTSCTIRLLVKFELPTRASQDSSGLAFTVRRLL